MPTKGTGRRYPGVMVSSSFVDLEQHRRALIEAIDSNDMKSIAMEHESAKADVDVIDSSLQMVEDCEAYCGVIGHRYGQTPICPTRNPDGLSLTHLELDRARELSKPILLFVMGDDHLITVKDVEADPGRQRRLNAFRADAKRMTVESEVERVYADFNSYEDFRVKATQAVARLGRFLDEPTADAPAPAGPADLRRAMPAAPELWAVPRYAGAHRFVGRLAELDALDDWARPSNPHPVLLFEAIGGTGKSMLTWHWTNERAPMTRPDWAGRFWYSFYERGADLDDLLRHALAYMTGQGLDTVGDTNRADLADRVVAELENRPWLFVLDGLERILVAYHRFDAAQLHDELAGIGDAIADRDVRAAVREEDEDLLRRLVTAVPSKLLLTSRLTPRVLLSASGLPVQGVRREALRGLRPPEAETLLRSCGVTGTSAEIQRYLSEHCDCHPLVVGVIAGLVNSYLPARGSFDAWAGDPHHGGHLDLSALDLIQKRNHILEAALAALEAPSRELLSTLALLISAADLDLLRAINPGSDRPDADAALGAAVRDLEQRGLVQFDAAAGTYDLHPVVRAIAFGALDDEQIHALGRRVVDHFSSQARRDFKAETLDDVQDPVALMRTLLRLKRFREAYEVLDSGLGRALGLNLPGAPLLLSLIQPFFPEGWAGPCHASSTRHRALLTFAAMAFIRLNSTEMSTQVSAKCVELTIRQHLGSPMVSLYNLQLALHNEQRLARAAAVRDLMRLVHRRSRSSGLFVSMADFEVSTTAGDAVRATEIWADELGRAASDDLWPKAAPWPENVIRSYVRFRMEQGHLDFDLLDRSDEIAHRSQHWFSTMKSARLRGEMHLVAQSWAQAEASFVEHLRLLREDGSPTYEAEVMLALARAEQGRGGPTHDLLRRRLRPSQTIYWQARLALVTGDLATAVTRSREAYGKAWADGEPFVVRYELDRAAALLNELGEPIPKLAPYDPEDDPPYPWEADVRERYAREPDS